MALFTAAQIRASETGPAAESRGPRAARAAAIQRLEQDAPFPRYSRVVVAGVVRLVEFWIVVAGGLALAERHFLGRGGLGGAHFLVAAAAALGTCAAIQALKAYTIPALRLPYAPVVRVWGALGGVFLTLYALSVVFDLDTLVSRTWLSSWFWFSLGALTAERLITGAIVWRLARAGRLERRAVVVGGGSPYAADVMRELAYADAAEARIVGVFDDRGDDRAPEMVEGVPKLGNVDDLVEFARRARIDLVIFALPISAEARILEMLRKLWVLPVDVRLAANANRLRLRPRSYSYIGRAALLDVFDKPLGDWDLAIKSAFDRCVGALALVALAPVMLAAAIAVKLDSRGPVLFRQMRYGFNNELIAVYKFRTLRQDATDATAEKLVVVNDSRVTRIGHFLRRTSIDELPQLFNVAIRGDLSLVGPRPHAINARAADRLYDEVVENYFARHRVKPGITGWAQINGWRGQTDTSEKLQNRIEHDLYYIENWSMGFDLYILAMTPFALFTGKNAF